MASKVCTECELQSKFFVKWPASWYAAAVDQLVQCPTPRVVALNCDSRKDDDMTRHIRDVCGSQLLPDFFGLTEVQNIVELRGLMAADASTAHYALAYTRDDTALFVDMRKFVPVMFDNTNEYFFAGESIGLTTPFIGVRLKGRHDMDVIVVVVHGKRQKKHSAPFLSDLCDKISKYDPEDKCRVVLCGDFNLKPCDLIGHFPPGAPLGWHIGHWRDPTTAAGNYIDHVVCRHPAMLMNDVVLHDDFTTHKIIVADVHLYGCAACSCYSCNRGGGGGGARVDIASSDDERDDEILAASEIEIIEDSLESMAASGEDATAALLRRIVEANERIVEANERVARELQQKYDEEYSQWAAEQ
jgi:hypothetical protein